MSAFVVNMKHISYLVDAACVLNLVSEERKHELGAMPLAENVKSVNFRYGEKDAAPKFVYAESKTKLSAPQIKSACECLNYQSCEHPEWETSAAFWFLAALKAKAETLGVARVNEETAWEIRV